VRTPNFECPRRSAPTFALRTACCTSVALGVLVSGVVSAKSPTPTSGLTNADKRTIAQVALQWAADGGLPDFKLVKDPSTLVVSVANLPAKLEITVPNRKVTVLPQEQIHAEADKDGDFLYFRFGPFRGDKSHATVVIALVWSVASNSKAQYLSGGGATLEFERQEGKWQLLPVTNLWMS
jgi:hypothetical protein